MTYQVSQVCHQTWSDSRSRIRTQLRVDIAVVLCHASVSVVTGNIDLVLFFTLGNTPAFKNVGDISRQSIRQNQVLRRFISWKNRALKLVRMSSKSGSQLQDAAVGKVSNLHKKPA